VYSTLLIYNYVVKYNDAMNNSVHGSLKIRDFLRRSMLPLEKSPKWLKISLAAILAVGLVGGPTAAMATVGDDESPSVESTEQGESTDTQGSEDEGLNEENSTDES